MPRPINPPAMPPAAAPMAAPLNAAIIGPAAMNGPTRAVDQRALSFEALGNDQKWKEVTQDQDCVTHFRFRYSLCAHSPGYDKAADSAWSRSATVPLTLASGRLPMKWLNRSYLEVDPMRALVTCMKPADDGAPDQVVVRLWETGGRTGAVRLAAPGYGT